MDVNASLKLPQRIANQREKIAAKENRSQKEVSKIYSRSHQVSHEVDFHSFNVLQSTLMGKFEFIKLHF